VSAVRSEGRKFVALVSLVTNVWGYGQAERTVVYALRNVTTGDTVDVSSDFSAVKFAVWICATNPKKDVLTATGNVVTVATAAIVNDSGYLMVYGSAS
jgi:hypothetical protein